MHMHEYNVGVVNMQKTIFSMFGTFFFCANSLYYAHNMHLEERICVHTH